jgi:isocitrate/isopropylmalate dehydrogenase
LQNPLATVLSAAMMFEDALYLTRNCSNKSSSKQIFRTRELSQEDFLSRLQLIKQAMWELVGS